MHLISNKYVKMQKIDARNMQSCRGMIYSLSLYLCGRQKVKFSNPPNSKMSRFLSTGKHSNVSFHESKSQTASPFLPSRGLTQTLECINVLYKFPKPISLVSPSPSCRLWHPNSFINLISFKGIISLYPAGFDFWAGDKKLSFCRIFPSFLQ
jgi:hypothetical protein